MAKHRRRRRGARRGATASDDALAALSSRTAEPPASLALPSQEPTEAGDSPTVANEAGLLALGHEIHRSGGRRSRQRRSRGSKIRRNLLVAISVVLLLVVAAGGYLYYITHDLNRITVNGLTTALTTGKEAGTENILMVGSTSRCALAHQNAAYGLCSQGVNGVNSDVIMILHVDPPHHRLAILSIPRDLFIPNARSTGANKIDAGLFQGISQVVAAVEEDFGIPIQHAVSLNFDQFANIVDALGGINMSFPESVFDAESGLNVQAASCVHLDGTQALQVVRARHLQYDGPGTTSSDAFYWPQESQSDLARIRRDHEFLRVLATAVAKKGLGNPVTDIGLINSVKADLTFDQSWAVTDMANLALDFHSANVNAVPQLTLPVAVVTDPNGGGGGLLYKGSSYGDVEFPATAPDESVIEQVLGVSSNIDTMTGQPLPAPAEVTVSVMNGSGATNQASDTGSSLTALGFHVTGVGDVQSPGDVSETAVYYGSRSRSTVAAAETVVHSLSGAVIMAYAPNQVTDGAAVTVVTGTQFAVNAPTASSGGVSTTTPTSTTSTTTPGSGAIASPSTPTSKLQPWDPRACAAGAVPTIPVPNRT
jgi:LCP family protein required for cell wall assembly